MAITRFSGMLGIGQSFIAEGYQENAYSAFMMAINRAVTVNATAIAATVGTAVSVGDLTRFRSGNAFGGSAILQANRGAADNYWVSDAMTNGPRLATIVANVGAYSPKPLLTFHSHGQQDVTGITTEADSYDVQDALTGVLWPQVRLALNPGNPSGQPIWLDMIGPRFAADEFAEYWLRDRFIESIEATNRTYMGSETYHLPFDATVHPTNEGYAWYGATHGRKGAAWLVDKNAYLRGPQIASAAIVGSTVEVTITVPSGTTLIKPEKPDFFGLFTSEETRVQQSAYSWVGNKLVIGFKGSPARLRYPARSDRTKDINNVIRLDNPDPLFVGEPGLVLESTKTIVL